MIKSVDPYAFDLFNTALARFYVVHLFPTLCIRILIAYKAREHTCLKLLEDSSMVGMQVERQVD
jgi:hypothetical protein